MQIPLTNCAHLPVVAHPKALVAASGNLSTPGTQPVKRETEESW
jgi:hypothetical protein